MHLIVNNDTVAFHHCVHGKSWLWLFLLGPAPFAFCFVSLLDGEAHIWLGDLRFALCGSCLFLFVLVCYDLPIYMTTGVQVDLILTCFFSCKDRASERYRPHRRKKKMLFGVFVFFVCFCVFCGCFLPCTVTAQWIMYRSNSVLFCITLSLCLMLLLH